MQPDVTAPSRSEAPSYVLRYNQSFDAALEAGRFLQARLYRGLYIGSGVGLLIGAILVFQNRFVGLAMLFFCALMLVTARFAFMDRLFGRRQARSVLGRPIVLTFGDDGIHWEGPQASADIPWGSLTEVRANARTVLFVRDNMLLAYAPAGAFSTPAQQAEVVAYSRSQIAVAKGMPRQTTE